VEINMTVWLIMLGLALGTFLIRASFIVMLGNHEIHPMLARTLRFVPASVLSALVVPQILTREDSLRISLDNPQLIAGVFAALVAWRTKNVGLTILVGMIVLWMLQALFPGI
jgi:branched-subunit amino acid transport protein